LSSLTQAQLLTVGPVDRTVALLVFGASPSRTLGCATSRSPPCLSESAHRQAWVRFALGGGASDVTWGGGQVRHLPPGAAFWGARNWGRNVTQYLHEMINVSGSTIYKMSNATRWCETLLSKPPKGALTNLH